MTTTFHEEEIRTKIKAQEAQAWLVIQNRMMKTMQAMYKQFDLKTTRMRSNRKAFEKSLQVDKQLDHHLSWVMETEIEQQLERMREASRHHSINDKIVADHKQETLRRKLELLSNDEETSRQNLRSEEADTFQVYCIAFVGGRGGLSAERRQQLRIKTAEEMFGDQYWSERLDFLSRKRNDDDDDGDADDFHHHQNKRPPAPSNEALNRTFSSMLNNNGSSVPSSAKLSRTVSAMTPPPTGSSSPSSPSLAAAGSGLNMLRRHQQRHQQKRNQSSSRRNFLRSNKSPTSSSPATKKNNNNNNSKSIIYSANDVALKALQQKVLSLSKNPATRNKFDIVENTSNRLMAVRNNDDDNDDEDNDEQEEEEASQFHHSHHIDFGTHRLTPEERLRIFRSNPFFYQNPEVEKSLNHDLRVHREEEQRKINKNRKQKEQDAAYRERLDYEKAVQEKASHEKQIEARKKTIMTAALARAYSSKSKALLRKQIQDELALLNASTSHADNNNAYATPGRYSSGLDDDYDSLTAMSSPASSFRVNNNNNNNQLPGLSPIPVLAEFNNENNSNNNTDLKSPANQRSRTLTAMFSSTMMNDEHDEDDAILSKTGDVNFIMSQSLNPGGRSINNSAAASAGLGGSYLSSNDTTSPPYSTDNNNSNNRRKKHKDNIISRNKHNVGKGPVVTSGKHDNIVTIRGENLGRSLAEFHQERRDMLESIANVDIQKLNEFERDRIEFADTWISTRDALRLVAVSVPESPFLYSSSNNQNNQSHHQVSASSSVTASPAGVHNNNNNSMSRTSFSASTSTTHHHHHHNNSTTTNSHLLSAISNLSSSSSSSRSHQAQTRIVAALSVEITKCQVLTHTMKDRLRNAVTVNHGELYRGYPFEGPMVVDDDYIEPVQDMLGRRNAAKKKKIQLQKQQQLGRGHNSSSSITGNDQQQERVSLLSRRRASIVADIDEKQEKKTVNNDDTLLEKQESSSSQYQSQKEDIDGRSTNDLDNPQPLARAIRFCSRILQLRKHINCLDLRSTKHPLNEIAMTEVICLLALCPQIIRVLWPKEAPPVKQTTIDAALRLLKENTSYLQRVFALCDVKNALSKLPSIEAAEADTLPMVRKIAHFTWELLRDYFDMGEKMLRQHVAIMQRESIARLKVLSTLSVVEAERRIEKRHEHEEEQVQFALDESKRREAIIGIEDRERRVIYRVAYDESTEIELRDQLRERTHHDERKKLDKERFEDMNSIRKEELKEHHNMIETFMKKMRILEKKQLEIIRQREAAVEAEAREEKLRQMEEARQRREEQMAEINRQSMLRTAATQRQIFESDERRARDRITTAEKKILDTLLLPTFSDLREAQHVWDRHRERLRELTKMRDAPLRCRFVVPHVNPDEDEDEQLLLNGGDEQQQGNVKNAKKIGGGTSSSVSPSITAPLKRNHSVLKQLNVRDSKDNNNNISPGSMTPTSMNEMSFMNNNNNMMNGSFEFGRDASLALIVGSTGNIPSALHSPASAASQNFQSSLAFSNNINNINNGSLSLASLSYDSTISRHYILESRIPLNLINIHSGYQKVLPHHQFVRALDISVEVPTPVFSWHNTPENRDSRARHIERARNLVAREAASRGIKKLPSLVNAPGLLDGPTPSLGGASAGAASINGGGGGGSSAVSTPSKASGAGKKSHHHHQHQQQVASPVKPTSKKEQELLQLEADVQNSVMESFDKEGEELIEKWKKTKENISNIEVSFATPQDSLFVCCWADPSSIAPRWQPKPEPKSKQASRPDSAAASKNNKNKDSENNNNNNILLDEDAEPEPEEDTFAAELEMLEASMNPAPVAIDYIDTTTGCVHFLIFDCHGDFYGKHESTHSEAVRPPLKSSHPHCNRVVASMVMEPIFAENFFDYNPEDEEDVREEKRSRYLEFLETMIEQPSLVPLSHFGRRFTISCPPKFSQTYKDGAETADDVSLHSDLEGKIFTMEETSKFLKWIAERIGVLRMKPPQPDLLCAIDRKRNLKKSPSNMLLGGSPVENTSPITATPTNNRPQSAQFVPGQGGDNADSPAIKPLTHDLEEDKFKNIFSNTNNNDSCNMGAFVVQLQSSPAPFIDDDELDPIGVISDHLENNDGASKQHRIRRRKPSSPLEVCPILSLLADQQLVAQESTASTTKHPVDYEENNNNDKDKDKDDEQNQFGTPSSFLALLTQSATEQEDERRIKVEEEIQQRRERERKIREEQEKAQGRKNFIESVSKTKFQFETSSILGQLFRKDAELPEVFEAVNHRFREGTDDVLVFPNVSLPVPFFNKLKEKGGLAASAAGTAIAMLAPISAAKNFAGIIGASSSQTSATDNNTTTNNNNKNDTSNTNNNNQLQLPTASIAVVLEIFATRSAFFDPADCLWFLPADHPNFREVEKGRVGNFKIGKNAFGTTQILRNGRPILYWVSGNIIRPEGVSIEFNQEENIWPPIEDAVNRVVLRAAPETTAEHIEDFLRSLVYRNTSKNIVVGKRFITATVCLINAIDAHFQDRVAQDADAVAKQLSFLSVIETEAIDDPTDIDFNWPATSNDKKCILTLPQPNQLVPQPAPPFLVCFNATVDDPDTPQFETFALAGTLLHLLPTGVPSPYRLNSTTKYEKGAQTFRYELGLATLEEMKRWKPLENEAAPGTLEPQVIFNHQPSLTLPPCEIVSSNINAGGSKKRKSIVTGGSRTPAISRRNSVVATSKTGTPSKTAAKNAPPSRRNSFTTPQQLSQQQQHHHDHVDTVSNSIGGNSDDDSNSENENELVDLLELNRETNELFIGGKMSGTFVFDNDNLSFRYDIVDCTLEELDMIVKRVCVRSFPILHPKTEGGPREALKRPPPQKADEIVAIQRNKQKLPSSHFSNHNYVLSSCHSHYRIHPMYLQLHLRLIPPKNLPRTPPTLVHQNIQVLPPLVVPSANSMIHKYREDSGKRPLALFEVGPGERVVNNVVSLSESDGWEQGVVMFRICQNATAEDFLSFEPDKDTRIVKVSDLLDDVALIGGIKGLTVPSTAELKKKREQEAALAKQLAAEKQQQKNNQLEGTANSGMMAMNSSSGTRPATATASPTKPSSANPLNKIANKANNNTTSSSKQQQAAAAPEPAPKKAPTASELSRAKTSGAILVSACKNPGWRHVVKTAHQYESYFVTTGVRHDIFALVEKISQHQLVITFRSTSGDFNSFVRRNDVANLLRKVHYEHTSDNPDVDAPKIVEVCSTTNNFVHISRSYVTILIQGVDDATELFRASVPRDMHDKQQLYPRIIRCEGAEDRRGFCPLDDIELDDPDTPCFNDFIITIQITHPPPSTGVANIPLSERIDFLSTAAQRVLNENPRGAGSSSSAGSTSARTGTTVNNNNNNETLEEDENRAKVVYALRQVTPKPQFKPDGSRVLCLTANNHPIAMAYLSSASSPTSSSTTLILISFKLDEDKYGEIRSHEVSTARWNEDIMNTEVYKFEETYPVVDPDPPTKEELEEKERAEKEKAQKENAGGAKGGAKKGGKLPASSKKPPAGKPKPKSSTATDTSGAAVGAEPTFSNFLLDNNNNDDDDNNTTKKSANKIQTAQNLGLLIPMSSLQELLRRIVVTVDSSRIPADGAAKQVTCKIKSREGAEGKLSFPVTFLPPCFHCPPGSVESEVVVPKSVPLLIKTEGDDDDQKKSEENESRQLLQRVSSGYLPLFGRACSVLLQPADMIATMRRNAMLKDENSFVHFQCILNPRILQPKENREQNNTADNSGENSSSSSSSIHRVTLQLHPSLLAHPTIRLKILPMPLSEEENNKKYSHRIVELDNDNNTRDTASEENNNNDSTSSSSTLFYVSQSFNKEEESSQLQIYAADDKYCSSAKLSDLLKCITIVRTDVSSSASLTSNNNNTNHDDVDKEKKNQEPQNQNQKLDFDEIDEKIMELLQVQDQNEQHKTEITGNYSLLSEVAANLNPSFFLPSSPSMLVPTNSIVPSQSIAAAAASLSNTFGSGGNAAASTTFNSTKNAGSTSLLQRRSSMSLLTAEPVRELPRPEQNLYFCHCKLVTHDDHDLAIKSFIVHA